MQSRRFQIHIAIQVALQILIPSIAPWLHSVIECGSVPCCRPVRAAQSDVQHAAVAQIHCLSGCCHTHQASTANPASDSSQQNGPDQQPHDCENCAICHAIAAPRILATVVELPAAVEQIIPVVVAACADPLLGFGLPPQCRAPPLS